MKNFFKKIIISIITWQAKLVIKMRKPKIVMVAGSVGKTSTKDAIARALSIKYSVRKSKKSFNSEFGVPLTILNTPNGWNNPFLWLISIIRGFLSIINPRQYPDWLVLEVGSDRPKDIQNIVSWLRPDVAVLTRMGEVPVHIEFFKNKDALVHEDTAIVRALKPSGTAVINIDESAFADIIKNKKALHGSYVVTYGERGQSHVRLASYSVIYDHSGLPEGINFDLVVGSHKIGCRRTGVVGIHHTFPVLAGLAVAHSQGYKTDDLDLVSKALSEEEPAPGRMRLVPGIKGTMLIDDSYNASPVATDEALSCLASIDAGTGAGSSAGRVSGSGTAYGTSGRKIAILGDMAELGQWSEGEHYKIGRKVSISADILITVGVRARTIADSALDFEMEESSIFQFDLAEEAGLFLQNLLKPGDIVLIKGSQSIRTEKIVREVMRDPDRASSLLVRQESFWLNK